MITSCFFLLYKIFLGKLQYFLFSFQVINSHEEGVYCLDHAIEHIENKPTQLKYCKLMYTYDIVELDNLIQRIKLNIEIKSQRKIPSKFAGMATLLK